MPATFAHCLIARKAIERASKVKHAHKYCGLLSIHNNFVTMGATGPDYPYLTDIITYGALKFGHNWANRMHYENVSVFVKLGLSKLSEMDKTGDEFSIFLAWLCGYVSHIIADSFVHPVVNCTVGGPYMFTCSEHAECELIQDIYIFNEETGTDIVTANPHDRGTFGYLDILDDCSDPNDTNRIHPTIRTNWSEILQKAHPGARKFFKDIDPDTWHRNYKDRVDFSTNPGAIFRHIFGMIGIPAYKKASEILIDEKKKYIDGVLLPNGAKAGYGDVFNRTVEKVVSIWKMLFQIVENSTPDSMGSVKNWNLDTGVDESRIDLWIRGAMK